MCFCTWVRVAYNCMKSKCTTFIRSYMIILDISFVLIGLSVICLSFLMLFSPETFIKYPNKNVMNPLCYLLLTTGITSFILATVNLVGVAIRNRCLLVTFFTIICGLLILTLMVGVLTIIFRRDIYILLLNRFKTSIQYEYGEDERVTDWIDFIQRKFACCAAEDGEADLYLRSTWFATLNSIEQGQRESEHRPPIIKLPASCCRDSMSGVPDNLVASPCQYVGPTNALNNPTMFKVFLAIIFSLILIRQYSVEEYYPTRPRHIHR